MESLVGHFDQLWKSGKMTRPQSYGWMRKKMKLSTDDAHIGKFDKAQCEHLVALVRKHFP